MRPQTTKSEMTAKEFGDWMAEEWRAISRSAPGRVLPERWKILAAKAAGMLSAELAPEPAKEEWPEWWGRELVITYLPLSCQWVACVGGGGRVVTRSTVEEPLRALVAAYEAARAAGVLPGLEVQRSVSGTPWQRAGKWPEPYRELARRIYEAAIEERGDYWLAVGAVAEALGQPTACQPDDAEMARRARAALERLSGGTREADDAIADVRAILAGDQPAGGGEG